MAKKDNKKGKDKKASKPAKSKPAAKKAAKPAAKKETKKKPAAKPVKKAAPAKKPVAKATPQKSGKKEEKKSAKAEKEIKTAAPAAKKTIPASKDKKSDKKMPKEEFKKVKPSAEELEGEGMELEEDIESLELDAEAAADDDDLLEEEEVIKPKAKGRGKKKRKGDDDDDDHVFDSDNLIRKQPIKIDLNKSLIKKGNAEQPKPFVNTNDNRTRYNDAELAEFKELILEKLKEAETDYELLKSTLSNKDNHGTDDTSPTFKLLEDGSDVLSKEETAQLAARQEKYIISLRNALVRIENKSYGICRVTGKLIPKERLRSVPHATLGIDAKLNQQNN